MAYNDWLTIGPTSGTSSGIVTVTISSHSGYSTRSKNVVVAATINGGTSIRETVAFTQTGASTTGVGTIKLDGTTYSQPSLTPTQITNNAGSLLSFGLANTNAVNFQYYIKLESGSIDVTAVTGILSAPSISGEIYDVITEKGVLLNSFTVTGTTAGRFRELYYSMDQTNLAKAFGKYQTYSFTVNSNLVGKYTNETSNDVQLRYGLNAIIATGTNGTGTATVPLTSIIIKYPTTSTEINVTSTGTEVGPRGGTSKINISGPSDMTWTATVGGGGVIS